MAGSCPPPTLPPPVRLPAGVQALPAVLPSARPAALDAEPLAVPARLEREPVLVLQVARGEEVGLNQRRQGLRQLPVRQPEGEDRPPDAQADEVRLVGVLDLPGGLRRQL